MHHLFTKLLIICIIVSIKSVTPLLGIILQFLLSVHKNKHCFQQYYVFLCIIVCVCLSLCFRVSSIAYCCAMKFYDATGSLVYLLVLA